MTCTKCGAEIDGDSKFCIKCGAPVGTAGAGPAQKSPVPKKPLIIGIAAVCVIAIIAAVVLTRDPAKGFRTPEAAFDAYATGTTTADTELAVKAYSDFMIEGYGGEEALKSRLKQLYDNSVGQYEGKATITFTATGHVTMLDEDVEALQAYLNDMYGADIRIDSVAVVNYEAKISSLTSGKEQTLNQSAGYAFLYDGSWYFSPVSM